MSDNRGNAILDRNKCPASEVTLADATAGKKLSLKDSTISSPASLSYVDTLEESYPEKFAEGDDYLAISSLGGESNDAGVKGWFPIARLMFILVASFNLVGMGFTLAYKWEIGSKYSGTFALVNIIVAILTRSEPFRYGLFNLVVLLFQRWPPYWCRHAVTTCLLHFRDLHSGCATSGVAWILVLIIQGFQLGPHLIHPAILACTVVAFTLLFTICLSSFPVFRHRRHNLWEIMHRVIGWVALSQLWTAVGLGESWSPVEQNFNGKRLLEKPDIFFALFLTLSAIQPWAGLRKVAVKAEVLSSSVVLLRFRGSYRPGYCGLLSKNSVKENHPFGITSVSQTSDEHYMCVTGEGDFTRDLIANPPTHIWTRNFKSVSLPILCSLFRSGLYVMTGSAIGVGLDVFMQRNPRCRWHLLWVSGNVEETYGSTIVSDLKGSFKGEEDLYEQRVTIWDSHKRGKPDLLRLINETVKQNSLEVVFVNKGMDIVQGCSEAGIPCFGPVWG